MGVTAEKLDSLTNDILDHFQLSRRQVRCLELGRYVRKRPEHL
jgi:hypothetical protein